MKKNYFIYSLHILVFVFVASILASSLIAFNVGYYGGDLEGINYRVDKVVLIGYTASSILMIIMPYFYVLFVKSRMSNLIEMHSNSLVYFIFFCLTLLTLAAVFIGGEGTIKRGVDSARWAELFFAFFNPFILIMLFLFYGLIDQRKTVFKSFSYALIFFIYLVLIVNSGFIGFFIFLLPIFLFFLVKTLGVKLASLVTIFLIFLVVPLRFLKYGISVGFENININDIFNLEIMISMAKSTLDRFSYVPNAIYISDNSIVFSEMIATINYMPYFQGYFNHLLLKTYWSEFNHSINLSLYQHIHGVGFDSNSTFPLVSYLVVDFFYGFFVLLYSLFTASFLYKVMTSIYGRQNTGLVYYLFFTVIILYVLQGWFWELMGFLQAALIFLLIIQLVQLSLRLGFVPIKRVA